MRQGDLVEVTLVNEDIEQGVTIHWHGVDVPNAEDGVAGVTQDAVLPGGATSTASGPSRSGPSGTTRTRSPRRRCGRGALRSVRHRAGRRTRRRGRSGASSPHVRRDPDAERERPTGASRARRPRSSRVRLGWSTRTTRRGFSVAGTPFRVVALDGTDLIGPTAIEDTTVEFAGGGRADVAFTMPRAPVWLTLIDTDVGLALNAERPRRAVDRAARTGVRPADLRQAGGHAVRRIEPLRPPVRAHHRALAGLLDGRPGLQWTINGGIFPHVPVFVVEEGDLVHVTITNDTKAVHPMPSRAPPARPEPRRRAVSGSPWWVDTLDVDAGERYEVAFRADNRHLDGSLPQPQARRGRSDDARRLRGCDHAVRSRSGVPQRARMTTRTRPSPAPLRFAAAIRPRRSSRPRGEDQERVDRMEEPDGRHAEPGTRRGTTEVRATRRERRGARASTCRVPAMAPMTRSRSPARMRM